MHYQGAPHAGARTLQQQRRTQRSPMVAVASGLTAAGLALFHVRWAACHSSLPVCGAAVAPCAAAGPCTPNACLNNPNACRTGASRRGGMLVASCGPVIPYGEVELSDEERKMLSCPWCRLRVSTSIH